LGLGWLTTNDGATHGPPIAPWNRFFAAICSISEYEFRPGHTVNFLAQVDLTEVERIRAEAPDERRPSYTAFVAKAVALSLQEFP
jgi:pyruvate/2-oxoglutarate dehydrogenase complex dihydrolipoamide acyltransferase (E2) component